MFKTSIPYSIVVKDTIRVGMLVKKSLIVNVSSGKRNSKASFIYSTIKNVFAKKAKTLLKILLESLVTIKFRTPVIINIMPKKVQSQTSSEV